MLRSSLLVVAILIAGAGAGHAQVSSDPQAVAPVVYSGTPRISANCAEDGAVDAHDPGCVAGDVPPPVDAPAIADYPPDYDYVPDYWEEAPAYVAPSFYLGVSLVPDYWGWPWYGYGWGYGWPYYYGYGYAAFGFGFGWPYYSYCCYWGGYWNSYAWHDHGHHDHGGWGDHGGHGDHGHWDGHGGGDHGGWNHGGGDHGGHGTNGYPGPYRYLGHGQYANQPAGSGSGTGGHGDRSTRSAANDRGLASTGVTSANRNTFAGGATRTAAFTNNPANGQGRYAGRAALPSASYYAAAGPRGNPTFGGDRNAQPTNYRASGAAGYGYARGNTGSAAAANQGYRSATMPGRGYASANYAGSRQAMARAGADVAPRSYPSRIAPSYPQQRYAVPNRSYARGAAPTYSAARGPMPSYSYSGRAATPSYARGGSHAAPRGGNGGGSAPHGGGSVHGGGHAGTSRGH